MLKTHAPDCFWLYMRLLGLGKKGGVVENRERYPGTGCGLSGKEEEGHYLPLTQAWLGPIPLIQDTKENEREE